MIFKASTDHFVRRWAHLCFSDIYFICFIVRTSEKLKEIQKHRKQKKISFIVSVKEALPSWAKKKVRGSHIQLNQLVSDTDDYQVGINYFIIRESEQKFFLAVIFPSLRVNAYSDIPFSIRN